MRRLTNTSGMNASSFLLLWIASLLMGVANSFAQDDPSVSLLSSEEIMTILTDAESALVAGEADRAQELFELAIEAIGRFSATADNYVDDAYRLMNEQELRDALARAEHACELAPDQDSVWYCRGEIHDQLGELDEAVRAYRQALEINSNNNACIRSSWELFERNQEFQAAIRFFEAFIEQNDENDWLYYFLGQALLRNGSAEGAVEAFTSAVRINPEDIENNNALLGALTNATELSGSSRLRSPGLTRYEQDSEVTSQAVAIYSELVQDFPTSIVPRLGHARTLIDAANPEKAGGILDELLLLPSLELNSRWNVADLMCEVAELVGGEEGRIYYDRAAEQYQRIYERTPVQSSEELQAVIGYSRALMGAERYEDAIGAWRTALQHWWELETGAPIDIYYEMGISQYRAGNNQKALIYFGAVDDEWGADSSQMTLDRVNLLGYMAEIYTQSGDTRSANKTLSRVINVLEAQGTQSEITNDQRDEYRLRLATGLLIDDQVAEAISHLRRMRQSDSHRIPASILLARAYLRNNQTGTAMDVIRDLEQEELDNQESRTVMGEAMIASEDYRGALDYLQRSTDGEETGVENLQLQAEALIALDRLEEAREIFEDLLSKRGERLIAWVGLGEIEQAMASHVRGRERVTRLEEAISYYEKAQAEAPTDQDIRAKLRLANEEIASAQAGVEASNERRRTSLIVVGILAAAGIPGLAMFIGYRRQFARRLFTEVLALERDLKQVIRIQIRQVWNDDWDRLGTDEGFAGRFPLKYLQKKLDKTEGGAQDVLDVSNFGHLVAIIESGWNSLGFDERATPRTRELVIAALSYVGNCRNAIFHSSEIVNESGNHGGVVRSPVRHMDHQVRTSLNTIRRNLDLSTVRTKPDAQAADHDQLSTPQPPVVEAVKIKTVPPPFPNVPPPPEQRR